MCSVVGRVFQKEGKSFSKSSEAEKGTGPSSSRPPPPLQTEPFFVPSSILVCFPRGSDRKESACMEKEMATHSSILAWKIS